jgi:CDP-diglyceride synthetase
MAAQSVPLRRGEHVDAGDDEIGLPRRSRPLIIGTHRAAAVDDPDDERPSAFERARDSGWLAPALLALLALLLILSAYVVGRAFAGHVASSNSSGRTVVGRVQLAAAT